MPLHIFAQHVYTLLSFIFLMHLFTFVRNLFRLHVSDLNFIVLIYCELFNACIIICRLIRYMIMSADTHFEQLIILDRQFLKKN